MDSTQRASAVERLRAALLQHANLTGGWPYYPGKTSRVESTCWALLALKDDATAPSGIGNVHLELLRSRQRADGLLTDLPQAPVNLTSNGTAACVGVHLFPGESGFVDRIVDGLIGTKGVSVAVDDPRQNNRLQGWPWMPDTFSWVEPTAWCVLALKRSGAVARTGGAAGRLAEAEALLKNRCCEHGGWNYGNASAVGQDLRPHIPTSALALLALQDLREDPVVTKSIAYLEAAQLTEASSLALGLTSIALRIFGRSSDRADEALSQLAERTVRLGNLHAIAIALYALTADRHNAEALRVAA